MTRAEVQKRYYEKNKVAINSRLTENQRQFRLANPELAREQDKAKRESKKARGYKQPPYARKKTVKTEARTILNNAVKLGKISRPSRCENCMAECKPYGHHDDYNKPLEVRWLCIGCHELHHHPLQALADCLEIIRRTL